MKLVSFILLTAVTVALPISGRALAAASAADQASEIIALEKSLAATRDELAAMKTALAISKSQTEAAESRIQALSQTDSPVDSLRSQVRVLERDLQSATTALKRLAAEKAAGEPAGSRQPVAASEDESTRRALDEAQQRLASVSQELAGTRNQLAAARELESRVRQLEAEKAEFLGKAADLAASKDELARIMAAHADAERRLAAVQDANALLARERDELRAQASKAGELEARVRQLEAEKSSAAKAPGDSTVSKEELARATAARADAETKLATALRSFTLVTKERDELRARLAELLAKTSGNQEKR
jgi:DNA repair exonuclease SbcCD ATPase subunit